MEGSPAQATLGKQMVGIRVTDLEGNPLSFVHASGRAFARVLNQFTCCLGYFGYLLPLMTEQRQALHDLLAGTIVVNQQKGPALTKWYLSMQPIITVLGANNTPQGPFTLAEIERKIQIGEFSLGMMAHAPGLASWAPLNEVMDFVKRSGGGEAMSSSFTVTGPFQSQYQVNYADYGVRFIAVLIDNVILQAFNYVITIIFYVILYSVYNIPIPTAADLGTPDMSPAEQQAKIQEFTQKMMEAFQPLAVPINLFVLFEYSIMFLYFAILDGMGGTVGKRSMGIIAVTSDGKPLSLGQSFLRAIGRFVSTMCCCCIGFLFPFFNDQKKALHDFFAGSIVVKK